MENTSFILVFIAMMIEAARTSETSVNYFAQQYISEDKSELHTRRRENLKAHTVLFWFTTSRFTVRKLMNDFTLFLLSDTAYNTRPSTDVKVELN
jgi:glutathione synthase/RimK-type ligase-like ATP-grasp enzyme